MPIDDITLDSGDYDQARKLIDINLSASALPDTIIELDVYKAEAIEFVQRRTDNRTNGVKRAAIYMLASLLCLAIPDITSESNAGFSWSKQKTDFEAKREQLEVKALDLIAEAEADAPTREIPVDGMIGFDVAERGHDYSLFRESSLF